MMPRALVWPRELTENRLINKTSKCVECVFTRRFRIQDRGVHTTGGSVNNYTFVVCG